MLLNAGTRFNMLKLKTGNTNFVDDPLTSVINNEWPHTRASNKVNNILPEQRQNFSILTVTKAKTRWNVN